jgi:hypothetical protein
MAGAGGGMSDKSTFFRFGLIRFPMPLDFPFFPMMD